MKETSTEIEFVILRIKFGHQKWHLGLEINRWVIKILTFQQQSRLSEVESSDIEIDDDNEDEVKDELKDEDDDEVSEDDIDEHSR